MRAVVVLEVAQLRDQVQVFLDGFLRPQADLLRRASPDLVPLVDAVAASWPVASCCAGVLLWG